MADELFKGFDTPLNLMAANTKRDKVVGQDELGRTIYETLEGHRYVADTVKAPTSIPETAKAAYNAIPPMEDWRLPTAGEVVNAGKSALQSAGEEIWNLVSAPTNPNATMGDVIGIVSSMGSPAAVKTLEDVVSQGVDVYDPTTLRMFFGPDSPKADLHSLDEAKGMEDKGFTPQEVWMKTGWWNSKNGWRFEIDDSQADLHPTLVDAALDVGASPTVSKLEPSVFHDDFFEALPKNNYSRSAVENSDLRLSKSDTPEGGFYSATGNINLSAATPKELRDVLMHELQHFEQTSSGAPSQGANPSKYLAQIDSTLKQLPREALEYLAVRREIELLNAELMVRRDALKNGMSTPTDDPFSIFNQMDLEQYDYSIEVLKRQSTDLQKDFEKEFSPDFKKSLDDLYVLTGGFTDLVKDHDGSGIRTRVSPQERGQKLSDIAFDLYQRNVGEAEARLTAKRKDLTPVKRSLRFPEEDYDVDPNTLISDYDLPRVLGNIQMEWENFSSSKPRFADGGLVQKLNLDSVRPFERPMTSGKKDKFVGQDELGNNIYETVAGKRYTVRPATEEESKTTRAKVEGWVDQGAPLPSLEQIGQAVKALPGQMYDSATRVIRGDGTVGEALSILPASGAAGMATRIGQEADASVLSAMGATHRVPSYKPVDEFAQRGLAYDNYGNTYNKIEFADPLKEVISEMEVPNNGLKGSQLIKELQDNPTVRNSQLRSEDWLEGIDPQKRYTKEEIQRLMEGKGWSTFASPANKYSVYQRQYNLVDNPVIRSDGGEKYVEYAIQAAPNYDQRAFRANSQHYTDNTVAHVRLSERVHGNESYVLVEELQSDLLQQGFQKPSRNWEEAKKEYIKNVSDPTRFHIYNRLEKEDLLEYGTLITEHVNGLLTNSEYFEKVDKLLSKLQQRLGMENDRFAIGDIYDVLMEANEVIPPTYSNITEPPVAKTEETVRLGLQTAMAHAYNSGLTKVVIPPFDEIVAKRFERGSPEFNRAMDPKSGFYATYVKGVQKALRGFQDEFGDKIRITNREMEYDPNASEYDFNNPVLEDEDFTPIESFETPESMFFAERFRNAFSGEVERLNVGVSRVFGREAFSKLNEIGEKIANRGDNLISDILDEQEELFFRAFKNAIWGTYPEVNLISAFKEAVDSQIPISEAIFKQIAAKAKPKPPTEIKQGIEIDFSGLVEDKLDLSKPKFAEGGVVENNRVDPVSGNPVPPGATPKEVRDDVDIKASEGEYIIPANVVRYLGLDKIEKMVNQAKEKLAEMQSNGRMGGEKGGEDDLPFGPEELMTTDGGAAQEKPRMAVGGLVTPAAPATPSTWNQEIDPVTGKPKWAIFFDGAPPSVTPTTPTTPTTPNTNPNAGQNSEANTPKIGGWSSDERTEKNGVRNGQGTTGIAGSVDTWTPRDFVNYNRQKNNPATKLIQGGIATMMPMGGLMVKARNNYLERRVPEALESMLKSGKDLQGNPLSDRDKAALRQVASQNAAADAAPQRKGLSGLFEGLTNKLSGKGGGERGTIGSKTSGGGGGERKAQNPNAKKGESGSISFSANRTPNSKPTRSAVPDRPSKTTSKPSSSKSSNPGKDRDSKSGRR